MKTNHRRRGLDRVSRQVVHSYITTFLMRHPARPLGVLREPADQEDAGLHQSSGVSGLGADREGVAPAQPGG